MKTRYFSFLLPLAAFAVLSACSSEPGETPGKEEGAEVKFTSSINTLSRAGGGTWEAGDRIGVFMHANGYTLSDASLVNECGNIAYTTQGGQSAEFSAVTAEQAICYPDVSATVDFIAYFPYAAQGLKEDFKYPVDVTDQSDPAALDLLYSRNAAARDNSHTTVDLVFDHVMSKIVLNVTSGAGVDRTRLPGSDVAISGMPLTADFSLRDGGFTNLEGAAGAFSLINTSESDAYPVVFEAVVIPQQAGSHPGRKLLFAIEPYGVLEWPFETEDEFVPGLTYTYSVVVNYNRLDVALEDISGWDSSSGSDIWAVYPEGEFFPMPNSYVVEPGEEITIPVKKAYVVWAEDESLAATNPDMTGAVTCEMVWEDVSGLISSVALSPAGDTGENSRIVVKTDASKGSGNAVIAVRVGGKIRWSWHLWVTDYDPDRDNYTVNNGTKNHTFMARNLGATTDTPNRASTFGMQYQWGRKDPFPAPSVAHLGQGVFERTSSNTKTLYGKQIELEPMTEEFGLPPAIMNPNIFYGSLAEIGFDWYTRDHRTLPHNNYLWQDENGQKTFYDPCPEGWRVPTCAEEDGTSPWYLHDAEAATWNYGWKWANDGYYPAAGFTDHEGSYVNTGVRGNYWLNFGIVDYYDDEDIYTGWAFYMLMDESGIAPAFYSANRCNGFSIRCIRDR